MDDLQDIVSAAELAEALNRELLWLRHQVAARDTMTRVGPIPPRFGPEQTRAILRIEATGEALHWLQYDQRRRNLNYLTWPRARDEAQTFMGVSIYEVRHTLPAPGWKIINPFRR